MFIRFISWYWAAEARTHCGFFGIAYAMRHNRNTPAWMREELSRELCWFADNLAVPNRLFKATGREDRNGVCWFRDTAQDHISHARYVCWILSEVGQATAELRSTRPGTLIWSDDNQIVALAERNARHRICA